LLFPPSRNVVGDPRRWSHLISFLRVCSVCPPYKFLNGIFFLLT
jgi:hypothetical protein